MLFQLNDELEEVVEPADDEFNRSLIETIRS